MVTLKGPLRNIKAWERKLRAIRMMVLDFDGVLTDNHVWSNGTGEEWVRCWRGDGLGLERVAHLGVRIWILSTERHPVVSARAKKLRLPLLQGVSDKAEALHRICGREGIPCGKTIFMGNDINDLPAFRQAGVSVLVADASAEVLRQMKGKAFFQTESCGGRGAVREFCEFLISLHSVQGGSKIRA